MRKGDTAPSAAQRDGNKGEKEQIGKRALKAAHQVQRYKDGVQELRRVGLPDERLQAGLKKASSQTCFRPAEPMQPQTSGSTHQKAKRVLDFLKNVQKFLFRWRASLHGQKVVCMSKRGVTKLLLWVYLCSASRLLLSRFSIKLFPPQMQPN